MSPYVNDPPVPKLSISHADLGAGGGTARALLTNTSSSGTAAFDVASFANDPGTTPLPNRGAAAVVLGGAVVPAGRWGGRHRRDLPNRVTNDAGDTFRTGPAGGPESGAWPAGPAGHPLPVRRPAAAPRTVVGGPPFARAGG